MRLSIAIFDVLEIWDGFFFDEKKGQRMYPVEQEAPSQKFIRAWKSAGRHLESQARDGLQWIRTDLNPPLAEHISFRIGNQLFFIFFEAAEYEYSRGRTLFLKISKEASATPCIMSMTEHLTDFEPAISGWGLVHAETGKALNPLEMVSDEPIEMSDWEVHDLAVQVVKNSLEREGKNVYASQSSLHIDPSIWFEESGKKSWVTVRAVRNPEKEAQMPLHIEDIKAGYTDTGYFASVAVADENDPFDPLASQNGNFIPLYRADGMRVRYEGLKEV